MPRRDARSRSAAVSHRPVGITLAAGDSAVTLIPALGGKIASLVLAGREWLWTSDVLPRRVPGDAERADDASYVQAADTGGYDECFPTVAACTLPAGLPHYGGLRLPDHGELWSQRPEVTVGTGAAEGESLTLAWTGLRMPYRFARSTAIRHDGAVVMHYHAANLGDWPLPFVWSAHPILPLGDRTRLRLPEGVRVRVDAGHGVSLDTSPPDAGRWPVLLVDGVPASLDRPAAVAERYACKLFLDMPPHAVTAAVEEDGARLSVAFDGRDVPHFGLWINQRGWSGVPGAGPYRNLAFEPCVGAPDSLTRALGEWQAAAWLAPGESRQWSLAWSGSRHDG